MNSDSAFFALRSELFGEAAGDSLTPPARMHLTAEQMASYVERNLSGDEFQMVTDHLTSCGECALGVEDLEAFSREVAPTLEREYRPAMVPSPAESRWRRIAASLPGLFRRSPGLAFGGALALLLLAVAGWLIWRSLQARETKQEIVASPSPQSLPAPPSQSAPPPQPMPTPEPAPAAPLVAQLNDGRGQLTLDQEGKLSGAEDLPPAYRSMLKEVLTTRRIERPTQLQELTRSSSPLMTTEKQASEFSVTEPVGKVLLSDRPTFRWSQMKGATAYVVEIYDNKFNLMSVSPQLTVNSWATPQPLSRGKVYSWQVKAIRDGQEFASPRPPAPQAKFRILDQAKASELMKAQRAYPSSHLTLGLLYAEAGLLTEAERELRLLEKANPGSEIARRLLTQIRAWRR